MFKNIDTVFRSSRGARLYNKILCQAVKSQSWWFACETLEVLDKWLENTVEIGQKASMLPTPSWT